MNNYFIISYDGRVNKHCKYETDYKAIESVKHTSGLVIIQKEVSQGKFEEIYRHKNKTHSFWRW